MSTKVLESISLEWDGSGPACPYLGSSTKSSSSITNYEKEQNDPIVKQACKLHDCAEQVARSACWQSRSHKSQACPVLL